jgi:SSS family solute:Na+ symporter
MWWRSLLSIARHFLCAIVFLAIGACGQLLSAENTADTEELRGAAINKLRFAVNTQGKWVKVHAAEWLLDAGQPDGIIDVFRAELAAHGDEPMYRIGIWRVLAQAESDPVEARKWHEHIKEAFVNQESPDRAHAAETMAKLRLELNPLELDAVRVAAAGDDVRLSAFCHWVLAVADHEHRSERINELIQLLDSKSVETRSLAAYALLHLGPLDREQWKRVRSHAQEEAGPATKIRMLGASLATAPPKTLVGDLDSIRNKLKQIDLTTDPRLPMEYYRVLSVAGQPGDIPTLTRHLKGTGQAVTENDAAIDLQSMAAHAILRLTRPAKEPRPAKEL